MMSRLWTKSEMLVNGGIRLSLYKSTRSKLQVAVGDVPGPMVNGSISFVTETDCDDGLPHTLEHLVFMGSKKYPFKGVLDIIANRCMADGTNAWTDQDHTCYTLSTVGSEGFFKVLPVYIDHLLCPMISDAQFATEVHHINGDGENAGVVYSEMQDHESEMENICDRKMKEVMYPPNNPYAVDSGGRLKNLRDSCNVNEVRNYHKKYYHLSNMLVTICGRVDHARVLEVMEKIEQEHLANIPAEFPRPFSFELHPPKESSEHRVVCPSDDETRGVVDINWFGPVPSDVYTISALQAMFDYLSNTAVSPLQKDFVLLPEPLASSAGFSISEQLLSTVHLHFGGVPTEKLDQIKSKFLDKTLKEHLNTAVWDMERMGFIIEQTIQNEYVRLETGAHDDIIGHVIGHQLFGDDDHKALAERVDQVSLLRRLKGESATYWVELLDKYFSKPSTTIIGVPSEKMVEQIANEEKARLKSQRAALGKEGLKTCGDTIASAILENTAEKPSAVLLDEFIVKNLEEFDRFHVVSKSNSGSDTLSESEACFLKQFPFPATVHHSSTKFVELFLLMDSHLLTAEQRSWLFLYTDVLFESAAFVDGEKRTSDEVAKLFTKDLVDHSIEVGVSGQYDKLISLRIKVSETGYANLAKWAEVFTKGVIFEAEKVKMCAQKLVSEAREKKRDGCSVAGTAINCLTYAQNSNTHMYDSLVLEKVHEKIAHFCDKDPKGTVEKLEEIRTALLAGGANAHILCDIDRVDSKHFDEKNLWKFASESFGKTGPFQVKSGESVDPVCLGRQKVVSVGGSESSFIYQTTLMDTDWTAPAFVPTLLFTQYLSQTEGPLWRGVRGDGLAYGANIYVKGDRKSITLSLYRCAQPSQAYEATKKIVLDIVNSGKVDASEFEAAKRSLVFDMMQREGTVSAAGKLSVIASLRQTPPGFNREFVERIWNATSADMLSVGGPRVAKLFENFVRAIAVHPSKVSEIKKSFAGIDSCAVTAFHFDSTTGCRRELRRIIRTIPCLGGAKKAKN